jgi:hypothetical protein
LKGSWTGTACEPVDNQVNRDVIGTAVKTAQCGVRMPKLLVSAIAVH